MTSGWTKTSARSSTGAKLTATEIRRRHSALAAVAAAAFVPGDRVEPPMNSAARARTSGIYSKDCSAAADASRRAAALAVSAGRLLRKKAGTLPIGWLSSLSTPRSEEHTSELQSLMRISYAVFCLKKKTTPIQTKTPRYPLH